MAKHIHLLPWEWYEGPEGIPGPHWRPPGGNAGAHALDLRTTEQRGTPGGDGGPGLFAYQIEKPGGIYLGDGLDAVLPMQKRVELRAVLELGELPSASVRELVGHLFTIYSDPFGATSRKPVRPAPGKNVRLTFAGEDVFSEPFTGEHVDRSVAVFQADYERAKADLQPWLEQLDAARIRRDLPPLTLEERNAAVKSYNSTLQKWTGAAALATFGRFDPASVLAMLPAAHSSDGARRPTTTVVELWLTTDSTTIATGQSQPWTEVLGNFATNEEEVGGGGGGPHWPFLELDTGSAYSTARCETAVSADDHYTEADIAYFATPDTNKLTALCTRFAAAADTLYYFAYTEQGSDDAFFASRTTGTNTSLVSAVTTSPLLSDISNDNRALIRGKSDGSLHTWYREGVAPAAITDYSDSGITGNLRGGVLMYDNVTRSCAVQAVTISDLVVTQTVTAETMIARNGWTDTASSAADAAVIAALTSSALEDAASPWNPVGDGSDTLKVQLEDVDSADGLFLRYNYKKDALASGKTVNLTVELRSPDGSVLLDSWAHTNIGTSVVEQEQDISAETIDGTHQVWFVPSSS